MAIKEQIEGTLIEVGVSRMNAEHFEARGYETKRKNSKGHLAVAQGKKISVKVEDLFEGSAVPVTRICDDCGKEDNDVKYGNIIKARKDNIISDGKDRCKQCAMKRRFELELIDNCIAKTGPHFVERFWNPNDAWKFSRGTSKKAFLKCMSCGCKVEKRVDNAYYFNKIFCPNCSDGVYYPEKFMYGLLKQLNIEFDFQKRFDWNKNRRYDFYIPSLNMIIETHGLQHLEEKKQFPGSDFKKVQEIDLQKQTSAEENLSSIKYVVIEVEVSTLNCIQQSILGSELSTIFDLSDIDWGAGEEFTHCSFTKKAIDMWNDGVRKISDIAMELKVSTDTVTNYLKKGRDANKCDYDETRLVQNTTYAIESTKKKVVMLSLDGEFIREYCGVAEAGRQENCSHISCVCRGERNHAGGHIWMWAEEYYELIENGGKVKPVRLHHSKAVIQLSLDGDFIAEHESIVEASEKSGASKSTITQVCKGNIKGLRMTGGYMWKYAYEYYELIARGGKVQPYKGQKQKVVQLTKDEAFVAEFESVTEAERSTCVGRTHISSVCKGQRKTTGGYKWKYAGDYYQLPEEE